MGAVWILFFSSEDNELINDIAKLHKVDRKIVERHYKEMLENVKNEIENEKEN